jgi:archaetidylinositol phosphate synthase
MRTTRSGWTVEPSAVAKPRPRSEWLLFLLQPLATIGVRGLARIGVDPQTVVWSHATVGVGAAVAIAVGGMPAWWAAALLLQLKTLLDNMDGGLARATGRVTQMGRYLDTVLDAIVNALLFAALALHGPVGWAWPLAGGAFVLLVLMLSLDFNLERRYRSLRGRIPDDGDVPAGAPAAWLDAFRGFYRTWLEPQDRAIDRFDRVAFERLSGTPFAQAPLVDRLAWNDLWSTATLVNLGLSTQLLLLGVCLALGQPFAYVGLVYVQAVYVVLVQTLRVRRFRRYLADA